MDLVIHKSPRTNPQEIPRDNCNVLGTWFQGTTLRVRENKNGEEKASRGMHTELATHFWMTRSSILHEQNASQNHSLGEQERKHLSITSFLHWSRLDHRALTPLDFLVHEHECWENSVVSNDLGNRSPPAESKRCSALAWGNVLSGFTWMHLVEVFRGTSLHS